MFRRLRPSFTGENNARITQTVCTPADRATRPRSRALIARDPPPSCDCCRPSSRPSSRLRPSGGSSWPRNAPHSLVNPRPGRDPAYGRGLSVSSLYGSYRMRNELARSEVEFRAVGHSPCSVGSSRRSGSRRASRAHPSPPHRAGRSRAARRALDPRDQIHRLPQPARFATMTSGFSPGTARLDERFGRLRTRAA